MKRTTLHQDELLSLRVNGVDQRLRLCASRPGLPPLLVVQGGPGLPLLNEVPRFRSLLSLEDDFTVAYWEQRGCGNVPRDASEGLSFDQVLDDLRFVIRLLNQRTGTKVALLGISLGGSLSILAASRESALVSSVIAISPDLDQAAGDEYSFEKLKEIAGRMRNARTARLIERLGPPPYLSPSRFRRRLSLVADLGGIERGKDFGALMAAMAISLIKCYGIAGALRALRNAESIQTRLLPRLAELDLLSDWPAGSVPIRLVFGEDDLLEAPSAVKAVSSLLRREDSLALLPRAGHMAHFDRPDAVKEFLRPR
jgi:pimeloyl-ACP methyl ester carboxylesterase